MARPISTSYTPEEREMIINHVLAELAGGRPISRTLKEDEGMPASSQFWRWIYAEGTPELQDKLARARGDGMEALLDEALVIADTPVIGEEITVEKGDADDENTANEDVVKVKRADMLGHRKLQIETRIKMAQMLKPKTYSPKLDVTTGGESINFAAQLEAARRRVQDGGKPASE